MRRIPRFVPTLLVLTLLVGTAVAFAVTERLKLVPSPIVAPEVDEAFAPRCACPSARARISFRLREGDRLTVGVVDQDGDVVRTLVDNERHEAGPVQFAWDGRLDDGSAAPEGAYRPRVRLAQKRWTIVMPTDIRLDATAPVLTVTSVTPTTFSPDGDRRADKVKVFFRVSEPASVLAFVGGRRAVVTRPLREGKLEWFGRRRGRLLRSGLYDLTVRARDPAGNLSRSATTAVVRIRYIALSRSRLRVPAGVRFGVRVSTDARRYRWRLGRRRGSARGDRLVLRAPRQPGRYTLRVSYGRYASAAAVFVVVRR